MSEEEIEALRLAREHVRVHMANEHIWAARDAAVEAIGKVIAAAEDLQERKP